MLTKAITYVNFNDEKKTKNFYFHLSSIEIARMNSMYDGGLQGHIKKIVESNDNREIFKLFEDIVLAAYGEKSADGDEFLKSDTIRQRFQCHPAYDILMTDILNGGTKAMSDFINAIIPKSVSDKMEGLDLRKEANKTIGFDVVPETEG